jgi:DEAD/DEAH box helicase domain-containing protein
MTNTPPTDRRDFFDPDALETTFPDYADQVQFTQTQPAKPGEYVDPSDVLPDALAEKLNESLYSHQAAALTALKNGENVTVSTPASSGKTWIYTLYYALLKHRNPDARALFLYPTRRLMADRRPTVNDLLQQIGVDARVELYDGDRDSTRRKHIREKSDVIISDFAWVNEYLPEHVKWHEALSNCELIVINESHTYTGIHGMHIAWAIRRLRRVLEHYNADPQLVCTPTTIGNPGEHSTKLTGADFTVIDDDGSPNGQRNIVFWQPPLRDTDQGSGHAVPDDSAPRVRRHSGAEAGRVAAHLAMRDVQSLLFTSSRKETEIGAGRVTNSARSHPGNRDLQVEPYHAGLGKTTRRDVERRLKNGELDIGLTTTALEPWTDIGSVDATILSGYPGTRQSFWQQAGRSGRGNEDSLSVFVPRASTIDQYILNHPEFLLNNDIIENAVIDLENNHVFAKHVLSASNELPLTEDDAQLFGPLPRLERAIGMWRATGKIVGALDHGAYYSGPPHPQSSISLYAASDDKYEIRCLDGEIDIEPIDKLRAYRDYHPGAIFFHNGQQYCVENFIEDRSKPVVEVSESNTNVYTTMIPSREVLDLDESDQTELGGGVTLHAGKGTIKYKNAKYRTDPIDQQSEIPPGMKGTHSTGLDPIQYRTQMMWVTFPESFVEIISERVSEYLSGPRPDESGSMTAEEHTLVGGYHGVEHGIMKMAPLFLGIDSDEIAGVAFYEHPETDGPVILIHDSIHGGVGFSHSIYSRFAELASKIRFRVANCDCTDIGGCPSCIMDSECGNNNKPLHSEATLAVLDGLLDRV